MERQCRSDEVCIQLSGEAAHSEAVDSKSPGWDCYRDNYRRAVSWAGPCDPGSWVYTDVDASQLERVYPWDRKYVIYSRASGGLRGWFEGRIERYEVEGESQLTSYAPQAMPGVIAFPVTGTVSFAARPTEIEVKNSDIRFFDTTIQADGRIHEMQADLNVRLRSSNLANLHFVYKDANGEGSFDGTLKGPIQKPQLNGSVVLDRYKYREWTIQHAEGTAALDTQTEMATLANIRATIGQSTATRRRHHESRRLQHESPDSIRSDTRGRLRIDCKRESGRNSFRRRRRQLPHSFEGSRAT